MTNNILSEFSLFYIANPELTQVVDCVDYKANEITGWRQLTPDIKGICFHTKEAAEEFANKLENLLSYKIIKGTIQVEVV